MQSGASRQNGFLAEGFDLAEILLQRRLDPHSRRKERTLRRLRQKQQDVEDVEDAIILRLLAEAERLGHQEPRKTRHTEPYTKV